MLVPLYPFVHVNNNINVALVAESAEFSEALDVNVAKQRYKLTWRPLQSDIFHESERQYR